MNYFPGLKSSAEAKSAPNDGLKVYFRGIHRIHINRFKAYVNILAGRLKDRWHITDDISQANVVATHDRDEASGEIYFELYDSPPNLKPEPIDQFPVNFNEHEMVKQLNLAGRKLKLVSNHPETTKTVSNKNILLAGYPDEVAKDLSQRLGKINKDLPHIKFSYISDILKNAPLFIEHLAYVINPFEISSINGFFEIEQRRKADDLTIDELTVLIIKHEDDLINEQVFDDVYNQCDGNTQVTLIDASDDQPLINFLNSF